MQHTLPFSPRTLPSLIGPHFAPAGGRVGRWARRYRHGGGIDNIWPTCMNKREAIQTEHAQQTAFAVPDSALLHSCTLVFDFFVCLASSIAVARCLTPERKTTNRTYDLGCTTYKALHDMNKSSQTCTTHFADRPIVENWQTDYPVFTFINVLRWMAARTFRRITFVGPVAEPLLLLHIPPKTFTRYRVAHSQPLPLLPIPNTEPDGIELRRTDSLAC